MEKKLTIERAFTSKPKALIKRGCNTVRERCLNFIRILREEYSCTHEIPLEEAKRLFKKQIGFPCDRTSIKAYFGTQPGKVRKLIHRRAVYLNTGTVGIKDIELSQDISQKEGYLELFGLISYEKRGDVWFMVLNNEASLVPEIAKSNPSVNERQEVEYVHR